MSNFNNYSLIGLNNPLPSIERRYMEQTRYAESTDDLLNRTETDVDFMNSLYRNTDTNYFLGSWIIKPVVEILLHFMGTPKIKCKDKKLQSLLEDVYSIRQSSIQNLFREVGLYGTSYAQLGYDGELNLPTVRPKNNTYIMETRYENYDDPDDITYIRVREIITEVNKDDTDPSADAVRKNFTTDAETNILIDKVYWKEQNKAYKKALNKGIDTTNINPWIFKAKMLKKDKEGTWQIIKQEILNNWNTMPVIAFHQNRLSADRTGYSDVSGVIRLAGVYHQILESAIDVNLYNGKPTPVFRGLENSRNFIKSMYGDISLQSNDVVDNGYYDDFGAYYLEGNSDVKYLELGSSNIDNAEKLLKILFYIFIQISGVPEWALGASITGAWATVKMQSTPLVQRIKSKRLDINDSLIKMHSSLAKINEANNPGTKYSTYLTSVEWDEPLPEDREYILSALGTVIPLDMLSPETILGLLNLVADPKSEIEKHNKQKEKDYMDQEEKLSIINKVKGKLAEANNTNDASVSNPENPQDGEKVPNKNKKKVVKTSKEGEMDKLVEMDIMLKTLFGENYLEELGVD